MYGQQNIKKRNLISREIS